MIRALLRGKHRRGAVPRAKKRGMPRRAWRKPLAFRRGGLGRTGSGHGDCNNPRKGI